MLILKPPVFRKYPEIIFGFSTKIGAERKAPYYFNLSFSVGDNKEIVEENRKLFFNALSLNVENVAYQKQVHGDMISYVTKGGYAGESDALITDKPGIGLAISIADCVPVFIYDFKNKLAAGVHSGWRSSSKNILYKTLVKLNKEFNSLPENLVVYVGPSIKQNNYEVGKEVADLFDKKYVKHQDEKLFLDVTGFNYDVLIDFGVKKENIQQSGLCTFAMDNILYSYRRDGEKSGRSIGVITLRDQNSKFKND
jgi:YfiH family protein